MHLGCGLSFTAFFIILEGLIRTFAYTTVILTIYLNALFRLAN